MVVWVDLMGLVNMEITCIGVHMVANMEVLGCMAVECIMVDLAARWAAMEWAWVVHTVIKIQTIHLVSLHHLQVSGFRSLIW